MRRTSRLFERDVFFISFRRGPVVQVATRAVRDTSVRECIACSRVLHNIIRYSVHGLVHDLKRTFLDQVLTIQPGTRWRGETASYPEERAR